MGDADQNCELEEVHLQLDEFQCEAPHRVLMRMEFEEWNITSLDVSNTRILLETIAQVLRDDRCKIKKLNLAGNEIGDEDLREFLKLGNDGQAGQLAKLTHLNLSNNSLECLYYCWFPLAMQDLDLSNNQLRVGFPACLSKCPALRSVNVENNLLHRGQINALVQQCFAQRENWTTLLIWNNPGWLDDLSLAHCQWSLVSPVKHLRALSLDVHHPTAALRDFSFPLAHPLCTLSSLSLRTTVRLREMEDADAPFAINMFARALESNNTLQALALVGFGLRIKGILMLSNALNNARNITRLDLRDNLITAPAIRPLLQQCAGIVELDLSDNMIESDGAGEIAQALQQPQEFCRNMQVLKLNSNQITDFQSLAQALRSANNCCYQLRVLEFFGNIPAPAQVRAMEQAMQARRLVKTYILLLFGVKRLPSELIRTLAGLLE